MLRFCFGPSGAGKSTIARAVAGEFSFLYVDTGAIYRTVGLAVRRAGIGSRDDEAIKALLPELKIDLRYGDDGVQRMFLCGEDVSDKIRTNEISMCASKVSALPAVRAFLLDLQRDMAKTNNVIMDGRDIGTVILPNATVKFFMNASDEAKAKRRYEELLAKGENITLEEVKKTMAERDKSDSTRKIAPAVPAADAIMLDNSESLEKTLETAINIIKEKTQ